MLEKTNANIKKTINSRLNRLEGQIKGIKKMVENDSCCNDILIQLSAFESATKSLSNYILENHLHNYITKDLGINDKKSIEKTINLLKRFNKQ